jgi:hypothetical protein
VTSSQPLNCPTATLAASFLQVQQSGIVMLMPGHLGTQYIVNQMVPTILQLLQQGAAIRAVEWEALMQRLDVHCSSMAMCLDHYRCAAAVLCIGLPSICMHQL